MTMGLKEKLQLANASIFELQEKLAKDKYEKALEESKKQDDDSDDDGKVVLEHAKGTLMQYLKNAPLTD